MQALSHETPTVLLAHLDRQPLQRSDHELLIALKRIQRQRQIITQVMDQAAKLTQIFPDLCGPINSLQAQLQSVTRSQQLTHNNLVRSVAFLRSDVRSEVQQEIWEQVRHKEKDKSVESLQREITTRLEETLRTEMKEKMKVKLRQELLEELRNEISEELREELDEEVRGSLQEELREEIMDNFREELKAELRESLEEELREELEEELRKELEPEVRESLQQEIQETMQSPSLELAALQMEQTKRLTTQDIRQRTHSSSTK